MSVPSVFKMTAPADRRTRVRIPLTLPVYLFRSGALLPIESKTKNVSCAGFYCYAPEPLVIDECIRGILVLPAFDPEDPNHALCLECRARVVRVELVEAGNYGIACAIDDYKVTPRFARDEITRNTVWT